MPVRLQSSRNDNDDEARIEIIPLIDIMFFLLASFMLVSLSMAHVSHIPLNIPDSTTASSEEITAITIAIDSEGIVYLDETVTTLTALGEYLGNPANAAEQVIIAADEETRHRDLVSVLDVARAAGVTDIGIETREQN